MRRFSSAPSSGFTLLIAVIFMSVMLSFGLALGALAFKQQVLASGAIASQYAFYAADAALECLLYADQQQRLYAYPSSAPSSAPQLSCDGIVPLSSSFTYTASQFTVTSRLSLSGGTRCADVTMYKPSSASGTSYLFSQGYDTSCATLTAPGGARFVSRGITTSY